MSFNKVTIAYWCVFIVALMPIMCASISKWGSGSRYNNKRPREWYASLEGHRARAAAAQANCWEALPFFAAAVIIAHQIQATQSSLNYLALAFVALRVAYVALYVMNLHAQRSIVWTIAFAINIWIFFLGA
jgi:uncharacterized MAPEG superfamily protein